MTRNHDDRTWVDANQGVRVNFLRVKGSFWLYQI